MSSDERYGSPSGQHNSTIEYAENAIINEVSGKKVFIVGEDGNQVTPTTPTDIQIGELIPMLRAILIAIANPSYVDKSANAMRNQIVSGTVTTVTTLTNVGSFTGDHLQRQSNMTAWATNIRNLIT